jgi:hypothetical protein
MSRRLAIACLLGLPGLLAAAPVTLTNGSMTAAFDERGLTSAGGFHFTRDEFAVTLAGHAYDYRTLPAPVRREEAHRVVYGYAAGAYRIDVVYELQPEWQFVSKQIVLRGGPPGKFQLDEFTVFRATLAEGVRDTYTLARGRANLGTGDYGGFLRFDGSRGLAVVAQNPFLRFQRSASDFTVSYRPGMDWDFAWGPFEADRGLLGPYRLSGRGVPAAMLPEWQLAAIDITPGMDEAEVATFTGMVRAFLLYRPARPLNIMVGWCVNDYQIDVGTPEGRTEYQRIFDMASALGADHVLFAPANSEVSRREDSRDDWGWEFTLWLGLGQKIRQNQWDPATGPIPASVEQMLDYARGRNLKLVAYVYPVMGFTQNPEWLVGAGGAHGPRANLGMHSFEDWLIQSLEAFVKHTGVSGFAFDHTFLAYEGASPYAQWWGWRRVMETLRRDLPDLVIDGRQAYQQYGPWSWLAGSYPHPTSNDEQPESFVSFPDLHLDRVSADRERYTAYRYRNYEFAPSEIVPGFITHQTPRSDDFGRMPEARTRAGETLLPFRQRDWDYLGWRYSLLSSVAIAGWNNVLDMIPARDADEFKNFSAADRAWFRHWIDWTAANREILRHTRTILGQPALGKMDGTAAIDGDHGFLFLFNPNARRLTATLRLDKSIGESIGPGASEGRFLLREIYPLERALSGPLKFGDQITRELDGTSAEVLELVPAPAQSPAPSPVLFNSPGTAELSAGALRISGARGEAGTAETLMVALPAAARVGSATVNGVPVKFTRTADGVTLPVAFEGAPFRHSQQIDTRVTGGAASGSFTIPQRIFDQLAARRAAWPIPWTLEDYRSTWLVPHRLLLYVQFAEADDQWTASLKIDGRPVDLLKAYASVRANKRNFTGFYADVSLLAAAVSHTLELELPRGLKTGQFLGVFFENVETEYTSGIAR